MPDAFDGLGGALDVLGVGGATAFSVAKATAAEAKHLA